MLGRRRPTDHERYLFDTWGYLVLRGVLSSAEVARSSAILDHFDPEGLAGPDGRDEKLRWLFDLDPAFADLMDHETTVPYLFEFVDEKVRVDGACRW